MKGFAKWLQATLLATASVIFVAPETTSTILPVKYQPKVAAAIAIGSAFLPALLKAKKQLDTADPKTMDNRTGE